MVPAMRWRFAVLFFHGLFRTALQLFGFLSPYCQPRGCPTTIEEKTRRYHLRNRVGRKTQTSRRDRGGKSQIRKKTTTVMLMRRPGLLCGSLRLLGPNRRDEMRRPPLLTRLRCWWPPAFALPVILHSWRGLPAGLHWQEDPQTSSESSSESFNVPHETH